MFQGKHSCHCKWKKGLKRVSIKLCNVRKPQPLALMEGNHEPRVCGQRLVARKERKKMDFYLVIPPRMQAYNTPVLVQWD